MIGKEATQQDRRSETFEKWALAAGSKLLLQEKPQAASHTEKGEQEKVWRKQIWGSRKVRVNRGAVSCYNTGGVQRAAPREKNFK